ncbi:MAG: peptide deformylase [Bacteroidales bacterium]|nr:peptide deformylase [Bacteroidales bacterium]
MSRLDNILKLGNSRLHQISEPIRENELSEAHMVAIEMNKLIIDFRREYGAGRAISAPQIAYKKRLICMHNEGMHVFINPELYDESDEMMELWDDCMSFPELLVKVRRHKSCKMKYRDLNWEEKHIELKDDLSELFQHEVDHLEGILATQRAIDDKAFMWRSERKV